MYTKESRFFLTIYLNISSLLVFCVFLMRIYTALQRGEYHLNFCEDQFFTSEIGDGKVLCAVMDGCTMAVESYFASTLVSKILRKISQTRSYQEFKHQAPRIPIELELKGILKDLFLEVNSIRNLLGLGKRELLTTIILLLVDAKKKEVAFVAIGDGLISIDDEIMDFDQDNKPDYLGFHLHEDFEAWYNGHTQKSTFKTSSRMSLSTDGIRTFTQVSTLKT